MARAAQQKVYADFRQGFVTVANPLAYPEGSVKDIENIDIQDNGTLRVRPGLRQESVNTIATGLTMGEVNNKALSTHVWYNVGNDGDRKFSVVQVGTMLYFFDMLDEGIDLSQQAATTLDMGLTGEEEEVVISTATGSGWLFVCHPNIKPFTLRYEDGDVVKEDITIKVRDLSIWEGESDTQTGYNRSPSLYPQHEYNLRNGGWPQTADTSTDARVDSPIQVRDPVEWTNAKLGFYPPISVPFYAARQGGGGNVNQQNAYSPWGIKNDVWGDSPVPRGKFVVEAESWTRAGDGTTPLTSSTSSDFLSRTYSWTQYPTTVEFYAGRVWYTGATGYKETSSVPYADYPKKDNMDVSNTIYFSQQIEDNLNKVGKCYQENDPTAEDINQLLATDGGTVSIRGAGDILDIKTFRTSLIVFATQGVWAISGIDTNSFKADSFSVTKISNIGPSSDKTISANNSNIYYIANDAIYVLSMDDVTGMPTPQDITSGKIKDFYNDIPYSQKEKAKAFFDTNNRNLYVFYSDIVEPDPEVANISYNKCLIFNQDLGCFYKYRINISSHYIVDGLFYNKDQLLTFTDQVVDGTDIVVDGTDEVIVQSSYASTSTNAIQLLTIYDNEGDAEFTFSSFTSENPKEDWGVPFTAFVEFGFDVAGDIMRDSLKAPVLISHLERTEDGFEIDPETSQLVLTNESSCLMSYGWDWASNYGRQTQIYKFHRNYIPSGPSDLFEYGVDVITTRNRIRGKGHSLGVRLDSEAGKDFRLLGFGILYTQARQV